VLDTCILIVKFSCVVYLEIFMINVGKTLQLLEHRKDLQ
jgi:hypothetical protein